MPRVSPLKLIDEAILPAFAVFGSKIAGLLLANIVFSLDWNPTLNQFSLQTPFIHYSNPASVYLANDFSTAFVFLVMAIYFSWVLFRATELNLSDLHPSLVKRLFILRRDSLLVDNYEIYHQTAVWLALSWFVFLQSWLAVLAGTISLLVFSWALVFIVSVNGWVFALLLRFLSRR